MTIGDIDPRNKVPFCERARSRVKKGPSYEVSLTLLRSGWGLLLFGL